MMDIAAVILEEYKIIRAEAAAALQQRITFLLSGATSVSAALAGAAAIYDRAPAISAILVGFVAPFLGMFVIWLWYNETYRHYRASHYLWGLERKLARVAKRYDPNLATRPFGFEHHVRASYDLSIKAGGLYGYLILVPRLVHVFVAILPFCGLLIGIIGSTTTHNHFRDHPSAFAGLGGSLALLLGSISSGIADAIGAELSRMRQRFAMPPSELVLPAPEDS